MSKSKFVFSSLKIASVIKPKNRPILQILEIANNNYIMFLPLDGDIEIYNKFFIYQFSISKTIHKDKISRITELKNGFLVTTSEDKTINIIRVDYVNKNYEVIQTLTGHTSSVWMALELSDGRMATCCNDKTIRIWQANPVNNNFELYKVLSTDYDEVGEMLETKNKILVTCSVFDAAFQVQLWSVEKYEKIGVVEDIATCGGRDLIQLTDDILCVNGSRDKEGLQLISISKKEKVKHFKDFNSNKIDSFYVKDGTLFIGCGEANFDDFDDPSNFGNIKQYKFDEEKLEFTEISQKEKCHSLPVLGFYEMSNGDFVSFSREVIVWK